MEDTEGKPRPMTRYERKMRDASKEIVRNLRNMERTRPDLEPDKRYQLAVKITTELQRF